MTRRFVLVVAGAATGGLAAVLTLAWLLWWGFGRGIVHY